MKRKNKNRFPARTDLAVELMEDLPETELEKGVSMEINWAKKEKVKETVIRITDVQGERALGKPAGTYITIEGEDLSGIDESYHEAVTKMLRGRLENMLKGYQHILVAGLGNQEVTSDSLGPLVVKNLFITRHLLKEKIIKEGKMISALSPGVMAQTGMETGEILCGVVKEVRPDVIVAVDALAARNVLRLNRTVQISDTGIAPGSGVGNHRQEISEKTMGVKVIAIGVPTVISVPAIIRDAFGEEDIPEHLFVNPEWESMYVTPKNIDEAVKKISFTISEALNPVILA